MIHLNEAIVGVNKKPKSIGAAKYKTWDDIEPGDLIYDAFRDKPGRPGWVETWRVDIVKTRYGNLTFANKNSYLSIGMDTENGHAIKLTPSFIEWPGYASSTNPEEIKQWILDNNIKISKGREIVRL